MSSDPARSHHILRRYGPGLDSAQMAGGLSRGTHGKSRLSLPALTYFAALFKIAENGTGEKLDLVKICSGAVPRKRVGWADPALAPCAQ
jgi:hypothetical protein